MVNHARWNVQVVFGVNKTPKVLNEKDKLNNVKKELILKTVEIKQTWVMSEEKKKPFNTKGKL